MLKALYHENYYTTVFTVAQQYNKNNRSLRPSLYLPIILTSGLKIFGQQRPSFGQGGEDASAQLDFVLSQGEIGNGVLVGCCI